MDKTGLNTINNSQLVFLQQFLPFLKQQGLDGGGKWQLVTDIVSQTLCKVIDYHGPSVAVILGVNTAGVVGYGK